MSDSPTNLPELTITELSGTLKRTIEDAFGHVRLRGEISGYRGPHSSGHVYFSLKDQGAKIDAVIWKGVFSRIKFRPEDGLEVIATGRVTTFPGKSSYQIIIEAMEPAGAGALMALLEERKRKLNAEGLFDAARKRPLPFLPLVIGIVTSPTGAVIRDILHRLADRFPRPVLLWPVRVQGEGSAEEVAAAIRGFNALPEHGDIPRPDVLIIARGGGSLEDLWSFNEEIVVRAAAQSSIPLVSAIGHETDWSLLDLVADIRAPTPTAAAEMVVPVRADLLAALRDRASRLTSASLRGQERRRRDLANLARALPAPERLLATPRQKLDVLILKRDAALRAGIEKNLKRLGEAARRLASQTPQARLARLAERLAGLGQRLPAATIRLGEKRRQQAFTLSDRLTRALSSRMMLARRDETARRERLVMLTTRLKREMGARITRHMQRVEGQAQLLSSLGYKSVLSRGYAVVRDEAGKALPQAHHIAQGQRLVLEFSDGMVTATAGEGGVPPQPTQKPRPKPIQSPIKDQGSLF